MPDRPPHASELVARYGQMIAGPEWGGTMARLTGVHQRTLSRIKAAAAEGREYPAARGVLAALYDAVHTLHAELQRYSRDDLD